MRAMRRSYEEDVNDRKRMRKRRTVENFDTNKVETQQLLARNKALQAGSWRSGMDPPSCTPPMFPTSRLAVGETVIPMTPPLHPHRNS